MQIQSIFFVQSEMATGLEIYVVVSARGLSQDPSLLCAPALAWDSTAQQEQMLKRRKR